MQGRTLWAGRGIAARTRALQHNHHRCHHYHRDHMSQCHRSRHFVGLLRLAVTSTLRHHHNHHNHHYQFTTHTLHSNPHARSRTGRSLEARQWGASLNADPPASTSLIHTPCLWPPPAPTRPQEDGSLEGRQWDASRNTTRLVEQELQQHPGHSMLIHSGDVACAKWVYVVRGWGWGGGGGSGGCRTAYAASNGLPV